MVKLLYYSLSVLVFYLSNSAIATDYGQQSDIEFPNQPQAQRLWNEKEILGDTIYFDHPVSLGTFTPCDDIEIAKVFDNNYNFLVNYTTTSRQYTDQAVRVVHRASYRTAQAQRTIRNEVVTAEGCIMACLTEKDFVCRDCDFFVSDGGKCALYETTGYIFDEDKTDGADPLYVGANSASVHYTIYKRGEEPTLCNDAEFAHTYFALGWKGMETGWYDLADFMFNEAIRIDPEFHMAYVGKMLSNEQMGYGMEDESGTSYKDHMARILKAIDFKVRLSLQEQLLVKALSTLQNGATLDEGLKDLIALISDFGGYKDNIINVVEGNAYLLSQNTYQLLNRLADENVFALQLLTHNLNPYKNGKDHITAESQRAAENAVFHYRGLGIEGAWQIHADCTDINEYYSEWKTGRVLLSNQKDFLSYNNNPNNPEGLFEERDDYLIVRGIEVKYSSNSLQRFNTYERLHFFELQLALYDLAETRLRENTVLQDGELWEMIRHRMTANAYFCTYDYIYNQYASERVIFEEDWLRSANDSSNDLAIASRVYYWSAAAVQKLYKKQSIGDIKSAISMAKLTLSMENTNYATLLNIYEAVVIGTEQFMATNYDEARRIGDQAALWQDELVGANFELVGNEDSKEFRMLIPLGYQFQADMLKSLIENEDAMSAISSSLTEDQVVNAYKRTVDTPPLNTSRALYGYGQSSFQRDENAPRLKDDPFPIYVFAFETLETTWSDAQVDGSFETLDGLAVAVQHFYDQPFSGCGTSFQIKSEGDGQLCWGGYVIIGVAAGLVVIIVIIIGILCLRKKAKAPTRDKEKDRAFIFSGPNLSRQESFGSSSRIGMGALGRDSPNATPYASQTLSIQRPFQDNDYTQRSNTIGGTGQDFEAHSMH